jgi:uncharacterized membrane protein
VNIIVGGCRVGIGIKKLSGGINLTVFFLSLAGAADSAYLAYLKFTGSIAACSNIGDCEAVNNSRYAEIAGIPIALLGVIGYLTILGIALMEVRYPDWKFSLRLVFFGFTLTGTLYSIYLTYVEVAVLQAICPFCVLSAVIMLALFLIGLYRLQVITASD